MESATPAASTAPSGISGTSVPMPQFGKIDVHSHLLPGIDDGCRNVAESLECIRQLQAAGYVGTVCTPHLGVEWFEGNTPELVRQGVKRLRQEIAAAGLQYQLWVGAELRLSETVLAFIEAVGMPTLAESKCVLVDYWGDIWSSLIQESCLAILERGYQPILAHPERMNLAESKLVATIEQLVRRGVWLQGNFNSIGGGEGPVAQELAEYWLERDQYTLLALDMHRPNTLPSRLQGLQRAEQLLGSERLHELVWHRPQQLLQLAADTTQDD